MDILFTPLCVMCMYVLYLRNGVPYHIIENTYGTPFRSYMTVTAFFFFLTSKKSLGVRAGFKTSRKSHFGDLRFVGN